ncbi:MAG: hypothetical protein ACYDGO_04860 [Smithellaceae bacterium]
MKGYSSRFILFLLFNIIVCPLFVSCVNETSNPSNPRSSNPQVSQLPRYGHLIAIDLDSDGIETDAMVRQYPALGEKFIPSDKKPIMFDYNGNGIRNNTGWTRPDDGIIVFDRNANGTIDNGRELFGIFTPLNTGGTAADGFAALKQEDSNSDGIIEQLDANWHKLRIWRDMNQDGISQKEELFTMDELGIKSFNNTQIKETQLLSNGNGIIRTGTFTKTNGTTGIISEVYFIIDTFTSKIEGEIPVAEDVKQLPDMKGSGLVRNLQQAATISPALKQLLIQYCSATTKKEQMVLIDQILEAWADTAGLAQTMESRDPDNYLIRYDSFGKIRRKDHYVSSNSVNGGGLNNSKNDNKPYVPDVNNANLSDEYRKLIVEWNKKLHVLEAFNGRYFFVFPNQRQAGATAAYGMTIDPSSHENIAAGKPNAQILVITYAAGQLELLNKSYESLRKSTYKALLYQTRWKNYGNFYRIYDRFFDLDD